MAEQAILFKLQKAKMAKSVKGTLGTQKIKIVIRDADSSNESEPRHPDFLDWDKVIGLMVGGNFLTINVVTVPDNKVIGFVDYDLKEVFAQSGQFTKLSETAKTDGSTGDAVCKIVGSLCHMPGLQVMESKDNMGVAAAAAESGDFSDFSDE